MLAIISIDERNTRLMKSLGNTIERKQESMPEYTRKKCHRIIKNGEDENS